MDIFFKEVITFEMLQTHVTTKAVSIFNYNYTSI